MARPVLIIPAFAFALGGALAATAAEAPAKEKQSPPPVSAGLALAQAATPNERYELAAITIIDKTTVLVNDTEEKRAKWLGIGDKFGTLELVSVDAAKNTAVVKVGNEVKVLNLKKSSIITGTNAAPISVVADATPAIPAVSMDGAAGQRPQPETPMTPADAEARDARMFVSDLLEIGIQQRRAFEQKKADDDAKRADAQPAQ